MTDRQEATPNRILVALDTSERGRAALEAAVRLAVNTSAELEGLFVEDEDLVRLASLPFSCEVDLISAVSRQLQLVTMERALHAAAEEAHQAFANALADVDLRWTFRIVRGTVVKASLAAAGDASLLVIGQRGRFPSIMPSRFVLNRIADGQRVVAIFDGSPSGFRTLEIAASLAESNPYPLSVLVFAPHGVAMTEQCLAWLQQQDVRAQVDQALNPAEGSLVDYVRKWPPSVLLINRDSTLLNEAVICQLVNQFEGPLILT